MVNVFCGSIANGPGNLQVVKKAVVTVGKFKDYINEIQQSYVLGFTPYRLHKNADGTFVSPHSCYDGKVYILDDVATMKVGDRNLITERKIVNCYILHGGLKGDSGDNGPVGSRIPSGKRGIEGPEGPPVKIGKVGPLGSRGGIGARGEKGNK